MIYSQTAIVLEKAFQTDMSVPAVDVGLVYHAGWSELLGYDLGGRGRLGD